MSKASFATRLLEWFDQHGRSGLPWQQPRSAYRVWLSEVMLQQTQVAAVIPYFNAFVARFPSVQALAEAEADEVMRYWAGLGYYARARNLHTAAKAVVAEHGGNFPSTVEGLLALPGVGRSTAGAIAAQAFEVRAAILDGNVKRVLARWGGIAGYPGESAVAAKLWALSEGLLPQARFADYTQALMDLGATLCTARNPACTRCPLAADCVALATQQTSSLPGKKPKRSRPLREAWLLLASNADGEWLLQQRPPSGIWGGLWCPPVVPVEEDWPQALAGQHGLRLAKVQEGAAIEHSFTHFDLHLRPLHGQAQAIAGGVREGLPQRWLTPAQLRAGQLALPAPITKYLQQAQAALPL